MHILLSENCFLDYTFYYIFFFFNLHYILNEKKKKNQFCSLSVYPFFSRALFLDKYKYFKIDTTIQKLDIPSRSLCLL